MKAAVADYQYRILCLRIRCANGLLVQITTHPRDVTMSNGHVYRSAVGYQFTSFQGTTSFTPSIADLTGIAGFYNIGKDEIASGVFDNARCHLFATTWLNPILDEEPITLSILGKANLEDDKYTIEEMALIDVLNQNIGNTYTATCQKRFGGKEFAGCKADPAIQQGTVTASLSLYAIEGSWKGNPDGFFNEGLIAFKTGNNKDLRPLEIRQSRQADGYIAVHEAFYYQPEVGDEYILMEGCVKTLEACKAKNNILNFGGFPNIPATSQYVQRGEN
jgi:uncharacterized phage protein (TIGR02218 family)